MTIDEMKSYIKSQNKTSLVKELVNGMGMEVSDAVEYVYDHLTLSKEDFVKKYF